MTGGGRYIPRICRIIIVYMSIADEHDLSRVYLADVYKKTRVPYAD
jgi:hypothetical protein